MSSEAADALLAVFCHKYGIAEKLETAELLTDKMLDDVMAQYRPVTVRITHSEQSGVTAPGLQKERPRIINGWTRNNSSHTLNRRMQ